MSTRSNIGIKREDGTIQAVYCHFDGYLEGVGEDLKQHYTDQKKVEKLIELGGVAGISVLAESIDCPAGHSFNTKKEGYTVFYGRDRGEKFDDMNMIFEDEDDYARNFGEEYAYLFENGKWRWTQGRSWREV